MLWWLCFSFFLVNTSCLCTSLDGPFCPYVNKLSSPNYFNKRKISVPLTNLFGSKDDSVTVQVLAQSPQKSIKSKTMETNLDKQAVPSTSILEKHESTKEELSPNFVGSFTVKGYLSKKTLQLDSKVWVKAPKDDWSAVNLIGKVNEQDLSIRFTLYTPTGEYIDACNDFVASFVPSSNKLWSKGKPIFIKGEWQGQYTCNGKVAQMTLELDTVGTMSSGDHVIEGVFSFSKVPEKSRDVSAITLDVDLGAFDLTKLSQILDEVFESIDIKDLEDELVNLIDDLIDEKNKDD